MRLEEVDEATQVIPAEELQEEVFECLRRILSAARVWQDRPSIRVPHADRHRRDRPQVGSVLPQHALKRRRGHPEERPSLLSRDPVAHLIYDPEHRWTRSREALGVHECRLAWPPVCKHIAEPPPRVV